MVSCHFEVSSLTQHQFFMFTRISVHFFFLQLSQQIILFSDHSAKSRTLLQSDLNYIFSFTGSRQPCIAYDYQPILSGVGNRAFKVVTYLSTFSMVRSSSDSCTHSHNHTKANYSCWVQKTFLNSCCESHTSHFHANSPRS